MKICIILYNFTHPGSGVSGGEVYLIRLIERLRERHEIRIITGHSEDYEWQGIKCYSQGKAHELWMNNNEHLQWCDVVITQLIGTAMGYNKATQHKKPLIFIAHNNATSYPVKHCRHGDCHVIYNSHQVREDLKIVLSQFNGFVLHPLIPRQAKSNGNSVTLVNCSHNKGGHILIELANGLPQINFIGVIGGYQDQIKCELPNVTYYENGTDMQAIYAQTKILIVPSQFESFSQVATEALNAGIPVLANPIPGIKENLSQAGIYINRDDVKGYENKILHLMNNEEAYKSQSELCLQRAESMQEMSKKELVNFDIWLSKIK